MVAAPSKLIRPAGDRAETDARDAAHLSRLSKLLLRQGRVYSGGHAWNGVHETWLRRRRFDDTHITAAFDHRLDAVLAATAARDRLDDQIVTVAASPRWSDPQSRTDDAGPLGHRPWDLAAP